MSAFVSRLLPRRSTATSRLYRPCRSSHSLHSASPRFSFSKRCIDVTRFLFRCCGCVYIVVGRIKKRNFPGKTRTAVQIWTVEEGFGIGNEFRQTCCAADNFRVHKVFFRWFKWLQSQMEPQDRRTPLPVRGAVARGAGKRAVDTLLVNFYRRGLPR